MRHNAPELTISIFTAKIPKLSRKDVILDHNISVISLALGRASAPSDPKF